MGHRYRRARIFRRRVESGPHHLTDVVRTQRTPQQGALEATFATMSDGVVVYDRDGRVVFVNVAMNRLLGVNVASTDAVLSSGEPASSVQTSATDGRHMLPEVILRMGVRPCGAPNTVPTHTIDMPISVAVPDGRECWLSVTCSPLRDASGEVTGTVAMFRDETGRQQLLREHADVQADASALRETVRHMEEFLAVAAHDLRSPLAAALGTLQLTQRRFARRRAQLEPLYPEFTGQFEAIHKGLSESTRGIQQLAQSVAVLLDVARASAGRLELKLQRCDLVDLVRRQVEAQRVAAARRDIRLALLAEQSVIVNADAVRVGEVVENYVTNALKYSDAERPVDVEVSMSKDVAHVAVRDSGPGLPPREQERVWQMYYRVPGVEPVNHNSEGLGLGLGLHICKRIVEQHGGMVGVESMIGAGSTFWFTLPLAPMAPEALVAAGGGEEAKMSRM